MRPGTGAAGLPTSNALRGRMGVLRAVAFAAIPMGLGGCRLLVCHSGVSPKNPEEAA